MEAEIAKNRLEELKLHEERRRKEAMRSRQLAERLGVEEAHMLEYQQFNMVSHHVTTHAPHGTHTNCSLGLGPKDGRVRESRE